MSHISSPAPALELTNTTVRYGNVVALDNISIRINRGDQIAVIGPNGAGKSTFLDLITGIQKPTSGRINVYGSEPNGHICIGYVPQRSKIDWQFPVNVFDVVMMGRASQIGLFRWAGHNDREAVERSLEAVGISHLAKRQISELSGGQQQRVFLARALAQETELLLLDEPFTGLDIPSQDSLMSILTDLQSQGLTMLVSTHDLNQAVERYDQILLLNRHIIGFGPPHEVLTPSNLAAAYGGHLLFN